ncbi:MAG: SIMPL domain-containing protein [Pseudomonadota bacterium]|nr:SIMPL domain-containing protein [Pseudomonadota bacterium]
MRLVVLAAAALMLAAGAPAAAQNARLELNPGETLLEVEATGTHRSRPDLMVITAGVVTTGDTASEALAANSVLARRVIEAVRTRGVAPADIHTTDLRIQPRFDESDRHRAEAEDRRPRIVGYIATNRVELTLRDLRGAPELLDALLGAGANDVSGPSFGLVDEVPAVRAAQAHAVRLARQEAEAYAEALGLRVVRVLRVSERQRYSENVNAITVSGSRVGPPPPVEPGEIETQVQVWVDYAMAPR